MRVCCFCPYTVLSLWTVDTWQYTVPLLFLQVQPLWEVNSSLSSFSLRLKYLVVWSAFCWALVEAKLHNLKHCESGVRHLLWSCSCSLMVGIKLDVVIFCLPWPASRPFRVACSAQATPNGSRGLAGFWLIIVSSQLFNTNLLWAVWIAAMFIKGHRALIWYCVCRIWPALHVLILFIAAKLLIISSLSQIYT